MDEATVRRHPTLTAQWCLLEEIPEVPTGDDHTKVHVDGAVAPLTGRTHDPMSPALGKGEFAQYEGRIREQIGYGAIEAMEDLEQIRNAARLSGAESFIEELPQQYETPLGKWEMEEGTVKLSGGQWQRLALARACMKPQGALVILDEPSAALDPEAEEFFFERLLREVQGKSVIFISHRFSTVRRADKILALRHGHIDEQGTHAELMQHNGRYAALFRMQARWYE